MRFCVKLLILLILLSLPAWALAGEGGEGMDGISRPLADGLYRITNQATGRFLNMQLAGMVDRAYVHQFGETGMLDEVWRVEYTPEGYTIQNAFSGRYLAVRNTPCEPEGVVQITVETEGEKHLWRFLPVGDGLRLVPVGAGEELGFGLPVNEIASKYLPVLRIFENDETSLWRFEPAGLREELPVMLPLTGEVFHASCPQIVKSGDLYYMYIMYPGILIKASSDLLHWETVGKVFPGGDPAWLKEEVPGYGIWAPSVYAFGGKYYAYYCISTLGSQNSAIGVAVNETLDHTAENYKWVDGGMVIRSTPSSPYNCIDPNIVVDEAGAVWLNFGSYWGGLYQRQIDPATGHLLEPEEPAAGLYHLARRNTNNGAVEAPYMIKRRDYYYLFVAFNPMDLTYHNRVGRSTSVHGPFVDKDGREMTKGGGTVVTQGMYELRMPGHASVFEEDGQYYFVGEYFREGSPSIMMISTIVWDDEGWPVTALTPEIATRLPQVEP